MMRSDDSQCSSSSACRPQEPVVLEEKDIVSLDDVAPTPASVSYSGATLPPSLTHGASSSTHGEITRCGRGYVFIKIMISSNVSQGNCGFKDINRTHFKSCDEADVMCGMMHCQHHQARLELGLQNIAMVSRSFLSHDEDIITCKNALVDLGMDVSDPGLAPSGSRCGPDHMCHNMKCVPLGQYQ